MVIFAGILLDDLRISEVGDSKITMVVSIQRVLVIHDLDDLGVHFRKPMDMSENGGFHGLPIYPQHLHFLEGTCG